MIASAQFTIISLCDVVTSDTPPENPYEGQLWVDTSVTPPESGASRYPTAHRLSGRSSRTRSSPVITTMR